MFRGKQPEEYPTYVIERATEHPQTVGVGSEAGLSRAFYVKPGVEIDDKALALISASTGVLLFKINPGLETAALYAATVVGRNLDSWAHLEKAIDNVGSMLNAGTNTNYTRSLSSENL